MTTITDFYRSVACGVRTAKEALTTQNKRLKNVHSQILQNRKTSIFQLVNTEGNCILADVVIIAKNSLKGVFSYPQDHGVVGKLDRFSCSLNMGVGFTGLINGLRVFKRGRNIERRSQIFGGLSFGAGISTVLAGGACIVHRGDILSRWSLLAVRIIDPLFLSSSVFSSIKAMYSIGEKFFFSRKVSHIIRQSKTQNQKEKQLQQLLSKELTLNEKERSTIIQKVNQTGLSMIRKGDLHNRLLLEALEEKKDLFARKTSSVFADKAFTIIYKKKNFEKDLLSDMTKEIRTDIFFEGMILTAEIILGIATLSLMANPVGSLSIFSAFAISGGFYLCVDLIRSELVHLLACKILEK